MTTRLRPCCAVGAGACGGDGACASVVIWLSWHAVLARFQVSPGAAGTSATCPRGAYVCLTVNVPPLSGPGLNMRLVSLAGLNVFSSLPLTVTLLNVTPLGRVGKPPGASRTASALALLARRLLLTVCVQPLVTSLST